MNQKLFREMSPDEQSAFISEFSQYVSESLPIVEQRADGWVQRMQAGLRLITVIPQSRSFVEQAFRYGDYGSRVTRFVFYINMIKEEIIEPAAIVTPPAPTAKRGRPASAATIAKREMEKKQPKLFGPDSSAASPDAAEPNKGDLQSPGIVNANITSSRIVSASEPDRLTLHQLKWLMSDELGKRVDMVRGLRTAYSADAEKAKTMAEMKASPDAIAPIAERAQRTLEQVEAIYRDVDSELAVQFYRLQNDEPYRHAFIERFKIADITEVSKLLRPYYQKMKSPEFDLRCRTIIEQESPEFVAAQKAEAEKKKEAQDIIRYLKRKDKGASDVRVKTSREKFKRLEQLLGKKDAAVYKPLLDKIIEDNKHRDNKDTKGTEV